MQRALVALALALPATSGQNYSSTEAVAYSSNVVALRAALLANYSKDVVPTSDRSNRCANLGDHALTDCTTFSYAGTDVRVEFQFYKLESVDLASGHMLLKTWLRMKWRAHAARQWQS